MGVNREEWVVLSDAFRILSPALGAWAIVLLRQILGQLRTLNGRVSRLEVWQHEHERHDLEQLTSLRREIEAFRAYNSRRAET